MREGSASRSGKIGRSNQLGMSSSLISLKILGLFPIWLCFIMACVAVSVLSGLISRVKAIHVVCVSTLKLVINGRVVIKVVAPQR